MKRYDFLLYKGQTVGLPRWEETIQVTYTLMEHIQDRFTDRTGDS